MDTFPFTHKKLIKREKITDLTRSMVEHHHAKAAWVA
jgi:hypothetical protein